MAYVRQLPSGRWAATVRTPAGRITETHELKRVIAAWAADLEADVRRGDFIDPRLGDITVGQWREKCAGARHKEMASRKRDDSHWRCHVGPRWATVNIGSILKPDISTWVVDMNEKQHLGAATIDGCVKVLRGLLELAVDARIIRSNPATRISRPRPGASVHRVLSAREERQLLQRFTDLYGDRVDGRLFVELLLDTGMRYEEAAALPPTMVDTAKQRIHIRWVLERDGTAREYAKSEAGNRTVTYSDAIAPRMAAAKLAAPTVGGVFPATGPGRLVFYSPGGGGVNKRKRGEPGPLLYSNWHGRVWRPALLAAYDGPPVCKLPGRRGPAPAPRGRPYLEDPQPTPHDCRHSFGTRLAENQVPQHEIMALMGHGDPRASQVYLNAGEERFERARKALDQARGVTKVPSRSLVSRVSRRSNLTGRSRT